MSAKRKRAGTTAASAVFDMLRHDLINGRFRAGEKLTISALKETYEVGLTPLREALNRLAAHDLLIQENRRGFRVPTLTREELDDIAEMRRRLEGMALEMALRHGDAKWESELLAAAHRLKRADREPTAVDQWEQLHSEFHRTLVKPCRSVWLTRFIEQLHDQFDRYRRMAPPVPTIRRRLDIQHEEMVDAALKREVKTALSLLEEHIALSYEVAQGSCTDEIRRTA